MDNFHFYCLILDLTISILSLCSIGVTVGILIGGVLLFLVICLCPCFRTKIFKSYYVAFAMCPECCNHKSGNAETALVTVGTVNCQL